MPREHLRLEDISDRELLLVLVDLTGGNGYATTHEVGAQLDVPDEHIQAVVTRLSWLKRFGALEREPDSLVPAPEPGEKRRLRGWGLTAIGHDLAMGAVRKAQLQAMEGARDGDMLVLTRMLAERQRGAGTAVQNLMRREYVYRTRFVR